MNTGLSLIFVVVITCVIALILALIPYMLSDKMNKLGYGANFVIALFVVIFTEIGIVGLKN